MFQSFSQRLIEKLTDWLIAFTVAAILFWFIITQPILVDKTNQAPHGLNTEQLEQHVQFLTVGYAPRTINYNNLNNTANYIYRQFEKVGAPEYQAIKTISQQYHNVSLQIGPDTEEIYVIGAHYDAENDSIDTEGNASGVATLIELARHLAANKDKLKIGVVLVAYPLSLNQTESMVDTGSYFHARSLKEENKKLRLMISLDGVGQLNTESSVQQYPFKFMKYFYPKNEKAINLVGRLSDFENIRELKREFNSHSELSFYSHNFLENINNIQSGDHINYWNHGYPAVLISDAIKHKTSTDSVSRVEPKDRLNYEKMAQLINGLSHTILQTHAKGDDKTRLVLRKQDKQDRAVLF